MAGQSESVVKSVGRVFAILELLEREARPLNALTIAKNLELPASSNFTLLKSMVTLGYLHFDQRTLTYFPTVRLSFLGNSFSQLLVEPTRLVQLVDGACEATGESAALSCENDVYSQFIRVRNSEIPPTYRLREGARWSLFGCCAGIVLLGTKSNQEIVRMAEKLGRRRDPQARKADLLQTLAQLRRVRGRRRVSHFDVFTPGWSMITWLVDIPALKQPLVLSVGGPTPRIKLSEEEIITSVEKVMRNLDLMDKNPSANLGGVNALTS